MVERLEQQALGLVVGDDVLIEAQLAARSDDAVELGQSAILVGDRAEHEARNRGVDALGVERQFVGDAREDPDRHRRDCGCFRRGRPQGRLRLDRDHVNDRGRVVGEVEALPGAELEHRPAKAFQESASVLGRAAPLCRTRCLEIHACEPGARQVCGGGGRHVVLGIHAARRRLVASSASRHSGQPSSRRRAGRPAACIRRTASCAYAQKGPRQ